MNRYPLPPINEIRVRVKIVIRLTLRRDTILLELRWEMENSMSYEVWVLRVLSYA